MGNALPSQMMCAWQSVAPAGIMNERGVRSGAAWRRNADTAAAAPPRRMARRVSIVTRSLPRQRVLEAEVDAEAAGARKAGQRVGVPRLSRQPEHRVRAIEQPLENRREHVLERGLGGGE